MQRISAAWALLEGGWAEGVAVDVAADGTIAGIETGVAGASRRILLPALCNLHSHSFQRAMAGMTETRAAGQTDSFWTWRRLMYRFLDQLDPDDIGAIAALTFVEMQEAGYAAVAEFHYLHHQPGGAPYADLSETSQRILGAARATGIGLTHLPVIYACGGAGGQKLGGGQLRFDTDPDRAAALLARLAPAVATMPGDFRLGIAPHSLRAILPEMLAGIGEMVPGGPIHMHLAEQEREVEEVAQWLGARPVDWVLGTLPVDERWCLIHATQMTDDETRALAATGAVAGLCPVTEANLGDGIFPGTRFRAAGGRFGIGSDSCIRITVAEEVRMLEYSQRLRDRARNVMAGAGSVGAALYGDALAGGAQALARPSGAIRPGLLADLVGLDGDALTFAALRPDQFLDGWLFAGDDRLVRDLWSAGRHTVQDGRHVARDGVETTYRRRLAALTDRL